MSTVDVHDFKLEGSQRRVFILIVYGEDIRNGFSRPPEEIIKISLSSTFTVFMTG